MLVLGMVGSAFVAFASGPGPSVTTTATATLSPGNLVASGPKYPVNAVSVALDGTDQETEYYLPITVIDATGIGNGWHLTFSTTQFQDGHGHTLPVDATTITTIAIACNPGSTCSLAPTSHATPLPVPANQAPVPFVSAARNKGMGSFTITPTVQITIPASTYAGSYKSTVTVTAISGP